MPIMFADSIDGGVLMIVIFGGGFVATVFALLALFPAWRGRKLETLCLIAPAFIASIVETCVLARLYFQDMSPGSKFDLRGMLLASLVLAGGPFFTSLLAALVLWLKCRKSTRTPTPAVHPIK